MSDGEVAPIIPIGTRGRPGRGSGTSASAAARGLARGPRPPRPKNGAAERRDIVGAPEPEGSEPEGSVPVGSAAESPEPRLANAATQAPGALDAGEPQQTAAGSEVASGDAATTGASQGRLSAIGQRALTRERHPLAGIPAADWQRALTGAAREVFGDNWEQQLAGFLAFLRRRITGDYAIDEFGFDAELTQRFLLAMLRPIKEKWFRVEVRGVENIPAAGGALVVSNHSGTLPVDALMTLVTIHDHAGRSLRALGADLVFKSPFVGSFARKAGATLACSEDAERMLRNGELVGVWPEGFKGVGKPYSERYKLQRFGRGGFVNAAVRAGVPIVPLAVVGAEEIYPLVGNVPGLAKVLGLPYLPITPFFPLLGPLGMVPLPSKWLMEFGEPIRTDSYDADAVDDPMLIFNVTDQVRETIQQTLYALLMQRQSVFR